MNDRLASALADRYRIEREIGQGGMATVFLAHDIRHDRDVAVKVLHADLGAALGGERFLSEIRTTARLQHPHILPLLDSGDANGLLYYVMPLVTGETLRARLEREKQLPVGDAIRIAREVADALGYAHSHGVIHRDIKPENILLQGGHALVADFGIALAVQTAGGQRMTQTGLSLGTPQYMSPEQAMGERTIDARSDIYALAAVTYEMLIGEAPFTGPTVQAIVARVMSEDPRPLATQRKAIPDNIEYAVLHGLEKLPADRWASAREFSDALDDTTAVSTIRTASQRGAKARSPVPWSARLRDPVVLVLAAVAAASVLFATLAKRRASGGEQQVVSFSIPGTPGGRANALGLSTLSISPDGRMLVYLGQGEGRQQQLLVRPVDDINARPLQDTEGGDSPTFSADGKWVLFIRGNQLYKTPVDGGKPQLLGSAPGTFAGASWTSTHGILISGNTALYILPESGGTPRELAKADRAKGLLYLDAPVVLEDEGVVLYSTWTSASMNSASIAIASLETGKGTVLDVKGVHPLGVVDDILIYVTSAGTLMGVPIDIGKRRVTGSPIQLATDVSINPTSGIARAALSRNGTLFYQSGTQLSQVVIATRDGVERTILDERREYGFPRLSPDGKQLAISIGAPTRRDIWLYELASGTMTRLTTEGTMNERPEWSPDGKRVIYRSDQNNRTAIWWRTADLSAPASALVSGERIDVFEAVISPDSRYIAYQLDTSGADVYYRALQGSNSPVPIANSAAIETMPRISPDGRWIAFTTDESGQYEVVVQPFPGPGGRVQVSAGGGTEPVWSRDGQRLYYRGDETFMAATLRVGSSFGVASRDTVFRDNYVYANNPHANYDALPDGSFVFLKPAGEGNLIVTSNWSSIVRARMAATAAAK